MALACCLLHKLLQHLQKGLAAAVSMQEGPLSWGYCALLVHVPFSLLKAMSEQCSLKSLLYLPYVEKQW